MGDIAEGLLDGTFDMHTGEYLGEGPGYPRSFTGSDGAVRRKPQKANEVYRLVKEMMGTELVKHYDNRRGVMTFINDFYESIGKERKRGTSWKYYTDVTLEHKEAFKVYIKTEQD